MAIPKRLHEAKGLWKGKSRLNQSWLPPEKRVSESASQLHVDTDGHDSFATVTYNWEYEGKRHEGTMLVCMAEESKAVQIGWSDSWHMSSAVMHLAGTGSETGPLKTKGAYSAGKETWGWTIALELAGDQLTLTMENLTPGGEAEWAVQAAYTRD